MKTIVGKEMEGASPAHDINHVMRVYNLCLQLASYEPSVDTDVLKTAALLHDIARTREDKDGHSHVLNVDHAVLGAEMSDKILRELGYSDGKIETYQTLHRCSQIQRRKSAKNNRSKDSI